MFELVIYFMDSGFQFTTFIVNECPDPDLIISWMDDYTDLAITCEPAETLSF